MIRLLCIAILAPACFGAPRAVATECRTAAEAPPGVRVPARPGCKPAAPSLEPREGARRSPDGSIDLGNGTQLRVGGRARIETDTRR